MGRQTGSGARRSPAECASPPSSRLGLSLDRLAAGFGLEQLGDDPLLFPRRFEEPGDREVVALVAALFAYGRVAQIRTDLEALLAPLGPHPAQRLAGEASPRAWKRRLAGWRHRFNDEKDAGALLAAIGETLRREGSLEALFLAGDDGTGSDLLVPLGRFASCLRDRGESSGPGRGWKFLLADPARGGASKRWNLFLRWVVRPGPIDLELWRGVSPSRLTLPLDAHVARISRHLGLVRRRSNDWTAAREATRRLAEFDAADPVRYDFALCRLGILDICRARPESSLCGRCPVASSCPIPGGGAPGAPRPRKRSEAA